MGWGTIGNIRGPAGLNGIRGTWLLRGSGVPTESVDLLPKDKYIDVDTGDLYEFVEAVDGSAVANSWRVVAAQDQAILLSTRPRTFKFDPSEGYYALVDESDALATQPPDYPLNLMGYFPPQMYSVTRPSRDADGNIEYHNMVAGQTYTIAVSEFVNGAVTTPNPVIIDHYVAGTPVTLPSPIPDPPTGEVVGNGSPDSIRINIDAFNPAYDYVYCWLSASGNLYGFGPASAVTDVVIPRGTVLNFVAVFLVCTAGVLSTSFAQDIVVGQDAYTIGGS